MKYDINDNKISTQTLIVTMNIKLELEKIFEAVNFEKEREWKQDEKFKLMALYYKNESKKSALFVERKKKKQNCFRNALNIVFEKRESSRRINIKVSRTGRLQITGCQDYRQVVNCIVVLLREIIMSKKNGELYRWQEKEEKVVTIYIQTVMTNIDFNVGFAIDRVVLHELLNKETTYLSLMETSFGYTGINIKIPVECDFERMMIPRIEIDTEDDFKIIESKVELPKELYHICYGHQVIKKKFNTFLVFHSGTIIMSGMMLETMKEHYEQFMGFITKWNDRIREKEIVTKKTKEKML